MGNTEDKKDMEMKTIPRNPNIPLKDDEVDALLKKAAEQISGREKKSENLKKEDKTTVEKKEAAGQRKPEEKKTTETQKIPEFKKKEDATRENIDLKKKAADKDSKSKDSISKDSEVKKKENTKMDSFAKKDSEKNDSHKKDIVKKDSAQKEKEFKVEDDIYVTKQPVDKKTKKKTTDQKQPAGKQLPAKNYKMTVGEVIGSVFEGIWIGLKLVVLLTIVTAIVGFFMSRDLMIRGRSGEQISKQGMNVAAATLSTRLEERKDGKAWNETVKKEKLTMEADDGKMLVAQKIVVDKSNDNWVVILHGQNGSVEDIYDIGFRYAKEGYNILMPDLRAHGESEGSYYGMGWLDRLDVINWIDIILDEHPSANVVIHGVDLGADTALMLSGEPLKESIKAIVAEGAYTSAWEAVKAEYKARHPEWPVFPIMHMLNPVAKIWGGYTLTEANAVEQVKKTSVPILLIRGGNDTYVTEAMTEELNQAIASEHEVFTVATGTHEDCRFAEPDTYYNKVLEFVGKYVK